MLADFFRPEEFAEKAVAVLRDPNAFRPLGRAAEQMIVEKYSLDAVLPEMLKLYEHAASYKLPAWELPPLMRMMPEQLKPARPAGQKKSTPGRSPFLG